MIVGSARDLVQYWYKNGEPFTRKDENRQVWNVSTGNGQVYFLTYGQHFLKKHILTLSNGATFVGEKVSKIIDHRRDTTTYDQQRKNDGKSPGALGRKDLGGSTNTFICLDLIPMSTFKQVVRDEMHRCKGTSVDDEAWFRLDFGPTNRAVVVATLNPNDFDNPKVVEYQGCQVKSKRLPNDRQNSVTWSFVHMGTSGDGHAPF